MAEFMFPFLSVAGDRAYSDADFATFYNNIFTNGVVATVRNKLLVKEATGLGMRVEVLSGAILVQGRQYLTTEPITVNVTPGSSTIDRTDLIVAQLDLLGRAISIVYKEGTTALVRNENYWEMGLAQISVPRNSTVVYNSMITDLRSNTAFCGYSKLQGELAVEGLEQQYASLLEQSFSAFELSASTNQTELEALLANQQTLFTTWFNGLQDTLTTNVEANLQAQIDVLDADTLITTITHNLNAYPHVQVLAWTYGIGMTTLGDEPAGLFGGSNVKAVICAVEYLNKQTLKVSVPIGFTMVTPSVTQISTHEWFLTEGINSLQIKLMEVN